MPARGPSNLQVTIGTTAAADGTLRPLFRAGDKWEGSTTICLVATPSVRLWALWGGFAFAAGACSDRALSAPEEPPLSDGGASPSADGGLGGDAAASNCRWLGYGIGPLGAGQCFSMHLMEHAVFECATEHGALNGAPRAISDQCVNDSDEVQVLCCYAEGIPDASSTDTSKVLRETLVQSDPPLSRTDILARAAATCAQSTMHMGDWSLRYAADGLTPDLLRFECQ